tara:strand:+ start:2408 stop:3112 length:705 start_codon:yes stop_codon:yes gene_type:complete
MWKNLKDNKSFQFVVGLATIWFGWVLYRDGWLHAFANPPQEGFGDAQWAALGATLLASAVSFVQLIGILTIGVLSGLLPHVEEGARWLGRLLRKSSQKAVEAAKNWKNAEKVEGEWNWKPLAATILAGALWAGGHLSTAWDFIVDHVDDVVEVLPRGEAGGRPVLDERDGHTGDLDFDPILDDRGEVIVDGDREEIVPDESVCGQCGVSPCRCDKKESQRKRKFPLGRLRLWKR